MRDIQKRLIRATLTLAFLCPWPLMGCEGLNAEPPNSLSDSAVSLDALATDDDGGEWESVLDTLVHEDDLGPAAPKHDTEAEEVECPATLPYATEVVSFSAGINAGFGQNKMPGVVLGPPLPGSPQSGSLDVLTLGIGGEIILGFGERTIVNGLGPDFIVWENPFWLGGDPETPFAELGEVAVSADGETWHTFPCDIELEQGFDPLCAGWRARADFEPCLLIPIDPTLSGGDPFDLEDIGLDEVKYVRIRDLGSEGDAPTAGFDLDAVGVVNLGP